MDHIDLNYDLIYENNLDTDKFARMLDDPTQCYKFYWLEAIITLMATTDSDLTFDSIINEMICNAWYSVTKYHLRLGPVIMGKSENFLEHAVKIVNEDNELPQQASKEDILLSILRNEETLKKDKQNLTVYVPYRLLSSFLDGIRGGDRIWGQRQRLIAYIDEINKSNPLPYTIIDGAGLEKKIHIHPDWKQFILDNYPVIQSWIKLKKVCFLQDRNPGVPGIIYKLDAESDGIRKLNNVRVLWKSTAVIGKISIRDIYSGSELDTNKFDLDHFVPWSYVTNDELWNLTPMDSQLNSSKSNSLPTWKRYFPEFANNQYHLYKMIFAYPEIRKLFEKCRRDNLNAIWASETLFISGNSEEQFKNVLEHNLRPIYDMAYLQGYSLWQFDEQSSALLVDDRSQENYKVNANH